MTTPTRHTFPMNPKMTRDVFFNLCHQLRSYEYAFVFMPKPDRGTKARSKRARQTLRTILTPSQLAQITKEARNSNAYNRMLYLNEDNEDPVIVRRQSQDAESAWNRILPNIYYSTFTFVDE